MSWVSTLKKPGEKMYTKKEITHTQKKINENKNNKKSSIVRYLEHSYLGE